MRRYVLTAIIGFLAWRHAHPVNSAFRNAPLPSAYFSGGDALIHCSTLNARDPPASSEANAKLAFCEDARFWDAHASDGQLERRRVVLSCDPGRKSWNPVMGPLKDPNPHGALWLLEYSDDAKGTLALPQRIKLEGYPKGHDFHPLGLDISASYGGSASNLFVVNHARAESTIEQFRLAPDDPTRAVHVRTLSSRYFIAPNAIALTSPTSFLLTNDHLLTRRLPGPLGHTLPLVETLFAIPLAFVAHVEIVDERVPGAAVVRHTVVKHGVPFANGIAVSPDGGHAAVASSSLARVHFYRLLEDAEGRKKLELEHYLPVPFAPDNVAYDDSGALLVAGHPFFLALTKVSRNTTTAGAPSWAVALVPRAEGEPAIAEYDLDAPYPASRRARAAVSHEIETLYQSDGSGYSSSSTVLRDSRNGVVFVSGLYEEGVLVCRP